MPGNDVRRRRREARALQSLRRPRAMRSSGGVIAPRGDIAGIRIGDRRLYRAPHRFGVPPQAGDFVVAGQFEVFVRLATHGPSAERSLGTLETDARSRIGDTGM